MEFEVHKFITLEDALEAIKPIDEHYGFSGNQTKTYATPQQYKDFWYIFADDVTKQYINEVTVIEFSDEEF